MTTTILWEATVDDLARVEGKAELVNGKILEMSPASDNHGSIAGAIFVSLREFALRTGLGRAYGDNTGFLCELPNRMSFSPDVSFYELRQPRGGRKFLPEPPAFAVEIRSESDHGPAAESAMAAKRADYFAAGTRAVWDVDAEGPVIVRSFLASNPESPAIFRRGEIAHAEPVLPGWRLPVDDILKELELK